MGSNKTNLPRRRRHARGQRAARAEERRQQQQRRRQGRWRERDPFAGLVLDETFVAGATRYEAPARTRAAIARFGPVEEGRPAWRPGPSPRRRRTPSRQSLATTARPRAWSPGRIVLALISIALLGSTTYQCARSKVDNPPPTALSADAPRAFSSPGDPATDADISPDLHRWDWKPGRCYRWPQAAVDVPVDDVPCAEPHLFEAVGPLDLEPAYPQDAPYPSVSQWTDIGERHCGPLMTPYLGRPIDPFGRFAASLIRPPKSGWEAGDRKVVCGLIFRGSSKSDNVWILSTFSGSVRGADQALTYSPGTCFRHRVDNHQDQVPCDQSHHTQSIGTATLPDTTDGGPPSPERFDELAKAACMPHVAPYLAHDFGGAAAQGGWHLIRPESWRAGTRSTTCTVGLVDQAGKEVETTGPLSPTDTSGTFTA
ncbi:septum formation family protein [Parafrankia soli]|uniref:septum formation family protein n=1 Tax=Parafrankia soli TaxID=2599596 RepID=UPI001F518805|nr:septum formation family protein [Parafrankia soli]